MEISTKELRAAPGKTLARVAEGREIVVTFRGKAVAKIVPIESPEASAPSEDDLLFGIWRDRQMDNVDAHIRNLRKGRTF